MGGNPKSTRGHGQVDTMVLGHGADSISEVFFNLNWFCEINFQHFLHMWIPAVPDSRQWMCGIGVQDVHPGQKDSSKQQPHSAKPIPLLGRKDQQQQFCQPLGSVPVLAMQYFFCFLLKICKSASSLSCPCRLTDRKCVFVHILAFPSWVLHHLILDFFSPTAVLLLFISGFLRCFSTFLFPWFHSPFPDCVR